MNNCELPYFVGTAIGYTALTLYPKKNYITIYPVCSLNDILIDVGCGILPPELRKIPSLVSFLL